jgi:uncharacterized ferredoxin-like protein
MTDHEQETNLLAIAIGYAVAIDHELVIDNRQ